MAAHTFCHLAILSVVFDCKPERSRFLPMCRPNPTEDKVPTLDEMLRNEIPTNMKGGSAFLKEKR